jgi:hypothetical protein
MVFSLLKAWLPARSRRQSLPPARPAARRRPAAGFRPGLCQLEDRTVPSGLGSFLSLFAPPGPATHLQVIVPHNVQAGQTFNIVVEAEDASNHLATGYTGTVGLSSSDSTATASATFGGTQTSLTGTPPFTYTFTARDHGFHVFQVTLSTPGPESVTATDTKTSTITGTASTNVNPPPTLAELVVVTPETAAVGQATAVTVVAEDSSGHVLRNFTGTVTLTSSDSAATASATRGGTQTSIATTATPPFTYTFTAQDHGIHTFQMTFNTADAANTPTTVTATDGKVSGSGSTTVSPAGVVTHFAMLTFPAAVAGAAQPVLVAALDASNHLVTGYTGTVTLTSSDTKATASTTAGGTASSIASTATPPFTYTFTTGTSGADNGVHVFYVTFNTTGQQSLTVVDTAANVTDTIDVDVVTQRHLFWWW